MIRFDPVPEPPGFDEKARKPGQAWLESNPNATRPKDLWSPFKPDLADGFYNLCGYTAIFEPIGTIDHYISYRSNHHLAYEWGNYRFVAQWNNASKQNEDRNVLDPFEVEDSWFEILLPSLQLVLTDHVPDDRRKCAEYTLNRLHLVNDTRVIRSRQKWYQLYLAGDLTLNGLKAFAPLIARAIENQQQSGQT